MTIPLVPVSARVARARASRLAFALMLASCATTSAPSKPAASYPGRCDLLALEQEELSSDPPKDQVALVATYRFDTSNRTRSEPVMFSFRVSRERAEDLRAHIASHPSVLCRPDGESSAIALPPAGGYGALEPMPAMEQRWPAARVAERRDRKVHMGHTFWDAIDARDALIDGNLDAAQTAARALRDRQYADTLPEDWKSFIGDMRKHADELAMAPDVETAAAELAMISLSCGNCHWFTDHGPAPLPDARVIEPGPEEQLADRMERHAVASDQMWEGLILPSDHAWHQGTVTFTRAPLAAPLDKDMPVDSDTHARIEELRGLARKARVATSHKERAQLYGQLIGRCASCHYAERR